MPQWLAMSGRRDFQSTPALKENPDNSITIFDYHRLLSETGWKVTHRIECPLSSERMSGDQVQKMQEKRILGTIGRTLIIARPCLGPTQTTSNDQRLGLSYLHKL